MITLKIKKILYFLLTSLAVLSLLRLSLFTIYQADFNSLSSFEIFSSFLMGIKVDAISVLTFTSIFILAILLPFKFTTSKLYNKLTGYLWYLVLVIIVFVIISDILYFQFVHRHLGNELIALGNDTHVIVDMIIEYKFLFLSFLLLSFGLFLIFKKIIAIEIPYKQSSLSKKVFVLFLAILFLAISIRGKIKGKPFSVSDAFVVNKTASGNLALNGFYTLYRTISKKKKNYIFYKNEDAISTTKQLLSSRTFKETNSTFPFQRSLKQLKEKKKKHNVVIVLLESWSAKFVDGFGKNNLKVTPNFDKLTKEGIAFNNFFANGQRSIDGITAILCGIPVLKGYSYLGKGLELSNLSYLGMLAKRNGYSTLAMQSSKRSSFRVDVLTKLAGFDEYYGAEDMSWNGDEDKDKKPRFGTWDGNMYRLLNQKLSNLKEPFLSFAFTSTTHTPFVSPGKKWEDYPHNNKNLFGYLNTLKYADDKLGMFIRQAKKEPWFENTIFIFLADHTIGFGDDSSMFKGTNIKVKNRPLESMRIPLLIYAPKIFKPSTNNTIGSQADLIPTIVDMLQLKGSFSSMSNSLFHPTKEQFAILSLGQMVGMVNKTGYIKHTLDKKLEHTGEKSLEKKVLSSYQTIDTLLKNNKWYNFK